MTIRDYLKRRTVPIKWLALSAVLLAFVLMLQTHGTGYQPAPGDRRLYLIVTGLMAAVVTVQLAISARLKCPRCGGSLSKLALLFAYVPQRVPACPHCHVSFDEPCTGSVGGA